MLLVLPHSLAGIGKKTRCATCHFVRVFHRASCDFFFAVSNCAHCGSKSKNIPTNESHAPRTATRVSGMPAARGSFFTYR